MSVGALDTALTGLKMAQQQLNVISNNIANVSTPGYTRKILPQSARAVNGEYVGVSPDILTRNVNISLQRDFWTQISSSSFYNSQIKYLSQIQQFNGGPDSGISFAAIISDLRDSFSQLSDDPSNGFLQETTVRQAQSAANKINEFSDFITKLRNDAQDEMANQIEKVNDLLEQISTLNGQIRGSKNVNRSVAALEDQRDMAIQDLSELIEISSFRRGDDVMVVQTKKGVQLADESATYLSFVPTPVGPAAYYPASASGIYVGGQPTTNPAAIEITTSGIGGSIEGLLDLRDNIFPQYIAQMDELAQKMALRFESQGLRLFTDSSGAVPPDTDPDTTTTTPVPYVGFSSEITVNIDIINDPTLLQKGTATGIDIPVQSGSNEVIRRILDFTFGTEEYVEALGTVAIPSAPTTLQTAFGLLSENTITTAQDLSQYTVDLNAAPGQPFGSTPPLSDDFNIRLFDTRLAQDTGLVNIDLTTAATTRPIGSPGINNAADQFATYINDVFAALPLPAGINATASVNSYGQVKIETNASIEIEGGSMGDAGLEFIGLEAGTYDTTDPYFDVQIGIDNPVRITIDPDDTDIDLLDKLNYINSIPNDTGVPNLFAEIVPPTNVLRLRPGDDLGGSFGGDLKLVGGKIETTGNVPILEALFGSANPVSNISNPPFRYQNLGPGVNIETNIISGTDIIDYAQKIINRQADDILVREASMEDEDAFKSTLERQFLDESAVNIEEELSNMIVVQTAFSAAAKAISAIDKMFDELITSIR